MTITKETMIGYLQSMMDDYKEEVRRYGEDHWTEEKLDAMIACKEMVEALIGEPVNLRKEGRVTVGF